MITTESFEIEKHYKVIASWWAAQNWPVLPLSHLPQTGIVVHLYGKPAAACWIYKTDSAYCLLEWIVADPTVRREARTNVLSVLISTAKIVAKAMGFQTIFLSSKHELLGQRLEAQGFEASDKGSTNYTHHIQGGKSWQ